MDKSTIIYLKLKKLQWVYPQIYSKLKNRNVVTVHINFNVPSLTQMLMINYPTSTSAHTFEVAFTVIFT